jgi:carboxymethylenebutenolidase
MKKLFYAFLAILTIGSSISWHYYKSQFEAPKKTDVIECLNMETLDLYKKEASQMAFASLHPSPIQLNEVALKGKMIRFDAADGTSANAYFIPSKKASKKWLIVIQEWWGLNDNIKLESDKYANDVADFNVLAVDMYDGKIAATPDSAMKLMRGADMKRMVAIVQGAIKHAGKDASIYSVGWCFGGMWSLQTAILAGAQAKGSIMFYGRPETDLEKLKSIQCDIIGFFGNQDQSPSPTMVNEFEANMSKAGKKITVNRYEAGHGFSNPSNPSYNAAAREDSYNKAIAFLKSH